LAGRDGLCDNIGFRGEGYSGRGEEQGNAKRQRGDEVFHYVLLLRSATSGPSAIPTGWVWTMAFLTLRREHEGQLVVPGDIFDVSMNKSWRRLFFADPLVAP
jgi:hypothetical protein